MPKKAKTNIRSQQPVNTAKGGMNQKIVGPFSIKHILIAVVACIIIYFSVETLFPKAIPCEDDAPEQVCSCLRHSISKNISFVNKLRILIVGASREELISHVDMSDLFRCALMIEGN